MGTRRGLLFGWLGMLTFSGTVVATRFAVRELDATFVAFGRALVAGVLAACVLRARRAPWPTGDQWRRIALVAAGVVVGFPWLITLAGIARVSQIQLPQPVCSLLWSALLLGERIDPATAFAALFVVGCVLVTSRTRVRVAYAVPEAP